METLQAASGWGMMIVCSTRSSDRDTERESSTTCKKIRSSFKSNSNIVYGTWNIFETVKMKKRGVGVEGTDHIEQEILKDKRKIFKNR